MSVHFSIPASLEAISIASERITTFCSRNNYSTALNARIDLAIVEALTNIVRHSLQEDKAQEIYITLKNENNNFTCVLKDQGKSFPKDLLQEEHLEKVNSNIELKENGYGLTIINSIMDDIKASRSGKTNILELKKQTTEA